MNPELSQERIDHLKKDYDQGFITYCGFKAAKIEHGRFTSIVKIEEHHRQQDGFIHAGIMATMADHTAGYSAFTVVDESFQILTIEFKINFLKPAFGSKLECLSNVIRKGRQILVAESEVYDIRQEKKVLAAKATVTLMAVLKSDLVKKKRINQIN